MRTTGSLQQKSLKYGDRSRTNEKKKKKQNTSLTIFRWRLQPLTTGCKHVELRSATKTCVRVGRGRSSTPQLGGRLVGLQVRSDANPNGMVRVGASGSPHFPKIIVLLSSRRSCRWDLRRHLVKCAKLGNWRREAAEKDEVDHVTTSGSAQTKPSMRERAHESIHEEAFFLARRVT